MCENPSPISEFSRLGHQYHFLVQFIQIQKRFLLLRRNKTSQIYMKNQKRKKVTKADRGTSRRDPFSTLATHFDSSPSVSPIIFQPKSRWNELCITKKILKIDESCKKSKDKYLSGGLALLPFVTFIFMNKRASRLIHTRNFTDCCTTHTNGFCEICTFRYPSENNMKTK